ncbi:uncharacterized protein J3R85_003229 [Psidium guajava]|nr:uncharacterized protein J3R85_003229 [Psidium guajava]
MILPVAKLGTLAVKTFSKPIASRIKKEATQHPKFRQLIINLAQANHRFTTQIQRRIYGHATDVAIRPLNEEKAVQAAADLAGELFVFSVAGELSYSKSKKFSIRGKKRGAAQAGTREKLSCLDRRVEEHGTCQRTWLTGIRQRGHNCK